MNGSVHIRFFSLTEQLAVSPNQQGSSTCSVLHYGVFSVYSTPHCSLPLSLSLHFPSVAFSYIFSANLHIGFHSLPRSSFLFCLTLDCVLSFLMCSGHQASAIFVLDNQGKHLISRDYRGDMWSEGGGRRSDARLHSLVEKFMQRVLDEDDEASRLPIVQQEGLTFLYVYWNSLYCTPLLPLHS